MNNRIQDSSSNWNAQAVIHQRKHKVQLDSTENHPAQVKRRAHIRHMPLDKDYIRSFISDLRSDSKAWARAGLSFTPSPTIATTLPSA